MSTSRQVTVWCDNCVRWEQASSTAARLRAELRRQGWTHDKKARKDYCPPCTSLNKGP